MTADTKIRAASLSKTAVGLCAMAMAEDGLADLDAPLGTYWGEGVRDPYAQTQPSIRTLMAHASGLKDFGVTRGLSRLRGTLSSSSAWRNVEPGTPEAWYYSNFGVCVLGVVTSVGGGMIRDLVLGIIPPNMFQHPVYTIVATVTSCIVFFVLSAKRELLEGHFRETYDRVMLVMDSIGLGIFTVVGVNTGINSGYMDHTFLLVFLGTITGVGGGLLRDMMAGVPPYIFVRHVYACASIVGAIACVYIYRGFGAVAAMVGASAAVIVIRYLAAHYHWNLPRLTK